jgi:pimeloyl-ACP methyl ester carboxylesterase
MTTFDLQHVALHGHDVSYRRAGTGPVIVLIHGIAGSSRTWTDVMPLLATRYTVIAPDLLGHGESAKPIGDYSLGAYASGIRDFLTVLDIPSATIVGQSFGGGVAMQLAYQHPEFCERIVLVGSGGLGRDVSWMLRWLTFPGTEYLMPALFPSFMRDRGDGVERVLRRVGVRSVRVSEMIRSYTSLADTPNRAAFVRTLRAVIDPGGQTVSALDRLYLAASVPTLIVWGDKDDIIPVSHAYAAHEAIAGSHLAIMEGATHFPHAEQPERFAEILLEFMESTEGSHGETSGLRELLLTHGQRGDTSG